MSKSKKAFAVPRNSVYVFEPEKLTLMGIDNGATETHPLYDSGTTSYIPEKDDGGSISVASVWRYGVLIPILVHKSKDGSRADVVAGRQRTRAARTVNELLRQYRAGDLKLEKLADKLGITEAEVRERDKEGLVRLQAAMVTGDDVDLMCIAAAENSARREESTLAKADRAKKLLANMPDKMPDPEKLGRIAGAFAVSETAVRQWLAITEAAAPVRRAVEAGKITATAAYKITKAGDGEAQREALEEVVAQGGKITGAKAARTAKRKATGDADASTGITSKRVLRELMIWAEPDPGDGDGHETSYWRGFADALAIVTGECKPEDKLGNKAAKQAEKIAEG